VNKFFSEFNRKTRKRIARIMKKDYNLDRIPSARWEMLEKTLQDYIVEAPFLII